MTVRLHTTHRFVPVLLGALALIATGVLLGWDAASDLFPGEAHNLLGALPLALIAVAYLVYQGIRRPGYAEGFKATLLALAFFFWAVNQYWPHAVRATLCNDIAIWLFVLDVFFVLIGWPAGAPDESFGEIYSGSPSRKPEQQDPNR